MQNRGRALFGKAHDVDAWTTERPSRADGKSWAHLVEPSRRLRVLIVIVRFDSTRPPLWLATNLPEAEASGEVLAGIYQQRW